MYTGGSFSASGDMKAGVPGHVVIVASRVTFMSLNFDIVKAVRISSWKKLLNHMRVHINIAYTDHGILLCGMNYTMYVHDQTMKCFIYFYRLYDFQTLLVQQQSKHSLLVIDEETSVQAGAG